LAKLLLRPVQLVRELQGLRGLALVDCADGLHLVVAESEPLLESPLHAVTRAAVGLDGIGLGREEPQAEKKDSDPSSVLVHMRIPCTGLPSRHGNDLASLSPG